MQANGCATPTVSLRACHDPARRGGRATVTRERLGVLYPGSARQLCALRFDNPFELLVATILSAQTTDVRVNLVTPALFAAYPDAAALAGAPTEAVEELVRARPASSGRRPGA